ncbi:MAG: citrate synthase/methylcitrate synthase [Candidatus Hydrothermarchaeaceae archaeon]
MNEKQEKKLEFPKGLEGVVACSTEIGYVDGEKGKLFYRGYDVEELAEHSTYEETTYLLLYGKLPTGEELSAFSEKLVAYRNIPNDVMARIVDLPCPCHPMSLLRTGISLLECTGESCKTAVDIESKREEGIKLIAQMATLVAEIARHERNQPPVSPDLTLPHAANFLYMLNGERVDPLAERVMDINLILHADHGMNASTFSAMVVASTLSDLYSSITAGIASLKGPLHGGANERVIQMLTGLSSIEEAEAYVEQAIANKEKIMGFGHRVYKTYDPRARVLQRYAKEMTEITGHRKFYEIALTIEKRVTEAYAHKGILPNVDFYSGLIYHSLGIEIGIFTPIFAVSRIAGWVARVIEYLEDNRLFRPKAVYTGPRDLSYVPMDGRG